MFVCNFCNYSGDGVFCSAPLADRGQCCIVNMQYLLEKDVDGFGVKLPEDGK